MKSFRRALLLVAVLGFATFYAVTWTQVLLAASASEHDRLTNGEPSSND